MQQQEEDSGVEEQKKEEEEVERAQSTAVTFHLPKGVTEEEMRKAAGLIANAKRLVVFSGAGISAESALNYPLRSICEWKMNKMRIIAIY